MEAVVEGNLCAGGKVTGQDGRCWRVEARGGSGTCCTVWRVHQDGHPTSKAALKVYKFGELYSAAASRETLLVNLVRTMRGRCPYIVEILDNLTYDGQACIIQPYLEADIGHMVMRNLSQALSAPVIQILLTHLLRGLSTLHSVGFVHADLKPANLLWNPQESVLTIIDFGLSFHIKDNAIGELQSSGYRAPEVQKWNDYILSRDDHELLDLDLQPQPSRTTSATAETVEPHSQQIPASAQSLNSDISSGAGDRVTKPDTSADMWSVGCIILDLLNGEKFFTTEERAKLPMQSQHGPHFLQSYLELKIRDAVEQHSEHCKTETERQAFLQLGDLCQSLLQVDRSKRLSAVASLNHRFCCTNLCLSHRDLLLLPSRVLRVGNALGDTPYQPEETRVLASHSPALHWCIMPTLRKCINSIESAGCINVALIMEEIQEWCEKYGQVVEVAMSNNMVFVVFAVWTVAVSACEGIFRTKFDGRQLTVSYFPLEHYQKQRQTAILLQ